MNIDTLTPQQVIEFIGKKRREVVSFIDQHVQEILTKRGKPIDFSEGGSVILSIDGQVYDIEQIYIDKETGWAKIQTSNGSYFINDVDFLEDMIFIYETIESWD